MYYKRNIEARSCNRCCRVQAMIITYSECVFEDLVIQHVHVKRIRHFFVCGPSGRTVFFHDFRKIAIEHKMGVLVFSTIFVSF
jgi:hypothetical protein